MLACNVIAGALVCAPVQADPLPFFFNAIDLTEVSRERRPARFELAIIFEIVVPRQTHWSFAGSFVSPMRSFCCFTLLEEATSTTMTVMDIETPSPSSTNNWT